MNVKPSPTRAVLRSYGTVSVDASGNQGPTGHNGDVGDSSMYAEYADIFDEYLIRKITVHFIPIAGNCTGFMATGYIHNLNQEEYYATPADMTAAIELNSGPKFLGPINKKVTINIPIKDKGEWYPTEASPIQCAFSGFTAITDAPVSEKVFYRITEYHLTFR